MDPIYIFNFAVTHVVELMAAIAGSIYLRRTNDRSVKFFSLYLWVSFAIEFIAIYALALYYFELNYEWFQWLKNSSFSSNRWLYELKGYIDIILICLYFLSIVVTEKSRILIKIITLIFIVLETFRLCFPDIIDVSATYNLYSEIVVVSFCVIYLLELSSSKKILEYHKIIHFYVAVGLLVWQICIGPIFIFSRFFREVNIIYHDFRILTILGLNILLYTWFTYGFFYCKRQMLK